MKRLLIAALAVSTLIGTAAMADSHGRGHSRDVRASNSHHDDRRGSDRHDNRHAPARRSDHHNDHRSYHHSYDHRYDSRYRVVRYYPPQDYRHYAWYRGARLPAAYYAPRYVVANYGTYRLRPPPRGYHWVRVDNDVVLAAITTGIVMQVVNGIFYGP